MEAVAAGGRREGGRTLDSASWRERLAPYAKPDLRRSALDVATSVAPVRRAHGLDVCDAQRLVAADADHRGPRRRVLGADIHRLP